MAFQMFQSSECAATSSTTMRARLVGLRGREIGRGRLGVDGNCRCFYLASHRLAKSGGFARGTPRFGETGSHEELHSMDSEHTSVIALRSSNIWVCGGGGTVGHVESRSSGFQLRASVVAHDASANEPKLARRELGKQPKHLALFASLLRYLLACFVFNSCTVSEEGKPATRGPAVGICPRASQG